MNTQRIASIVRQVVAVLVSIYGVLSATVSALHLPVAVSAILTAAGPVIMALEHYLSDPSTGTPPATPPVAQPGVQAGFPTPGPQPIPEVKTPG